MTIEMQQKIKRLEADVEALKTQVAELLAKLGALDDELPIAARRGRPRKVQAAA